MAMNVRLLGLLLITSDAAPPFGKSPVASSSAQIGALLEPVFSFTLDPLETATPKDTSAAESSWRSIARTIVSLRQVECDEDIAGATVAMLDAAEKEDPLAMAALGTMFLLGQDCAPKRNLTWGVHWLKRAARAMHPDALALLGFLHDSDALRLLYNFTEVSFERTHAVPLYEAAAAKGSLYASMVLGHKHANGLGGLPESVPASAAHYETAALRTIAQLEPLRRATVEQSAPVTAEHNTQLKQRMEEREKMDAEAIEYMDYCAHIGDAASMVGIANLYHTGGSGVPRDLAKAERWFELAADAGEPLGHACLGLMLMRSHRFDAGIRSLRRGIKLGDPSAWAGLGYAYLYGAGVPQDDTLAGRSLYMAGRLGHIDAIYNLGVLAIQRGGADFATADATTAFRYWSFAAEYGQPQAQVLVGRMMMRGLGVRKDCHAASRYLKHCVDNGPLARSLLGVGLSSYEAKHPQRSLMHYLLAAHAGISVAQQNVGYLYSEEMPQERAADTRKLQAAALRYLQEAALAGSADAKVQLAALLQEFAPQKQDSAVKLYSEAVQEGSVDALWHLGYHFWKGRGVKRDRNRAFQLFMASGFSSQYAKLRGFEGFVLRTAQLLAESRDTLFLVGIVASVFVVGDPRALLQSLSPQPQMPDVDFGDEFDWTAED